MDTATNKKATLKIGDRVRVGPPLHWFNDNAEGYTGYIISFTDDGTACFLDKTMHEPEGDFDWIAPLIRLTPA